MSVYFRNRMTLGSIPQLNSTTALSVELGSWTPGDSLPGTLSNSQCAIIGDYVYLFGGTGESSRVSTVYKAPITNGSLGSWTTGDNLPGVLTMSQCAIIGDYVYLFGGRNASSAVSTVYKAPLTKASTYPSPSNLTPEYTSWAEFN